MSAISHTTVLGKIHNWINGFCAINNLFDDADRKINKEINKLGLTNVELFYTRTLLRNIGNKHHSWLPRDITRDANALTQEINNLFAWHVRKQEMLATMPPEIPVKHLNTIRTLLAELTKHPMKIDDVRNKIRKILSKISFITESEINDLERRARLIRDRIISGSDITVECNCLFARIRTIFHNRGQKLPRQPNEEAQSLITSLLQNVKASDISRLQKLASVSAMEDIDFPITQLSFERYQWLSEESCVPAAEGNILTFACTTGHLPTIQFLLRTFCFDVTEEEIKALYTFKIKDPQRIEIFSYLTPLISWGTDVESYFAFDSQILIPSNYFMWCLTSAGNSPNRFIKDIKKYKGTHKLDVYSDDRNSYDPNGRGKNLEFHFCLNIWQRTIFLGFHSESPIYNDPFFDLRDRLLKRFFYTHGYLNEGQLVLHAFIPNIKTALSQHLLAPLVEMVLQYFPKTLSEMPPEDRFDLFDLCEYNRQRQYVRRERFPDQAQSVAESLQRVNNESSCHIS